MTYNKEEFDGGTAYNGPDGFYVETTKAYDEGCLAGSEWMHEGGTDLLPSCPYSGQQAKEWKSGFNSGCGEEQF